MWLLVAAQAVAADRSPVSPLYVTFPAIFVPIIEGDRVTRQIGVTLDLELYKSEDRDEVEAKRALLNDAFLRDLYAFFQQRAETRDIDESYLKTRLLATANAVVGPHLLRQVLIEQLFEQPK